MRKETAFGLLAILCVCTGAAAQGTVVVHDPTKTIAAPTKLPAAYAAILQRDALPAVRRMISKETCEEAVEEAGFARGAFTSAGAKQALIFYQYCQTGNGFGWNGLVLIQNGKMIGNFVSDGGWGVDIGVVPDINQNGLSEFTLAYSGGLHQGAGGIGVELVEFVRGRPVGIGWYKAEAFGETESSNSWKLTAKPGKPPVFYKQKYSSPEGRKPRPVGRNAVTRLDKAFVSKFEAVK